MSDMDRVDILCEVYRVFNDAGDCFCGRTATYSVALPWMLSIKWVGPEGRLFCTYHAQDWARAGYPDLVRPLGGA